ncbi:MAG: NADH-quinone oxidoreductase subunit D [Actinobacteria bacterium]|nr:NADH-quinone oxidoreductase subunit D [Actinomycetota bacterium]
MVGVGVGANSCDIALDLGDLHPSGHGALRLACRIDDGVVTSVDVQPGLLHRGTEKLLEVRDYRQALMLANRHDWLSAVTSEVALALAVEGLLGLEPPPRATWLRTILCEVNRAAAALLHAAGAAGLPPLGPTPARVPGMRAREELLRCLESISGGRVHVMITRIGGLANDAPDGWSDQVAAALGVVSDELPALHEAIEHTIPPGLAVVTRDDAVAYGVSGPVARAAGLRLDARVDQPHLAYPAVAPSIATVTAEEGDALSRYRVLLDQLEADLPLILALLDGLPEGPVDVPLPKVVRAPEGTAYCVVESATGRSGAYVVSVGETTPWRVRLRTPSYAHAQAMAVGLPGTPLELLAAAIGSFMCVAGDTDH